VTNKRPPKWFDQTWGHPPDAWDEARRQCRDALINQARSGHLITYGNLVKEIPAVEWAEGAYTGHGSMIGLLLGQVSAGEWLEDRPLLSAMAINADLNRPSQPFFTFARDDLGVRIGTSDEQEDRWWYAEVNRCQDYWRNH
jgi:hypothetical protein